MLEGELGVACLKYLVWVGVHDVDGTAAPVWSRRRGLRWVHAGKPGLAGAACCFSLSLDASYVTIAISAVRESVNWANGAVGTHTLDGKAPKEGTDGQASQDRHAQHSIECK